MTMLLTVLLSFALGVPLGGMLGFSQGFRMRLWSSLAGLGAVASLIAMTALREHTEVAFAACFAGLMVGWLTGLRTATAARHSDRTRLSAAARPTQGGAPIATLPPGPGGGDSEET